MPYRSAQPPDKPATAKPKRVREHGLTHRPMAQLLPRIGLRLLLPALVLLAAAPHLGAPMLGASPAQAQAARVLEGVTVGPVTGFPLPRFVSIRPDRANVRVGPGGAYDIDFTFQRSGLPVEIIAEFGNWRKIRDMDGDEGWIRHDLLTGRRMAVIAPWSGGDPLPARGSPSDAAATRYLLEPGVLATLRSCDGNWCDVSAPEDRGRWRGYVEQSAIWGAYPDEQFDAD